MANEKNPKKHQLPCEKKCEKFILITLTQNDATHIWMKKWNFLPTKETTYWTKTRTILNEDTKASARFQKMAQRNDASCIVKYCYIFNLSFVKRI